MCRLEVTNLSMASGSAQPPTSFSQSSASPTVPNNTMEMPRLADIIAKITDGTLVTHETKQSITSRQLLSHVCYLQKKFNLPTGLNGGWSPVAEHALHQWLATPKKGSNKWQRPPSPCWPSRISQHQQAPSSIPATPMRGSLPSQMCVHEQMPSPIPASPMRSQQTSSPSPAMPMRRPRATRPMTRTRVRAAVTTTPAHQAPALRFPTCRM